MKKSLLLSAAALATVLGVNAQDAPGVVTWDFNTHGIFANFQDPDAMEFREGNYDFIDKNGATVNTDKESMVKAIKTPAEESPTGSAFNTNYGKNNRVISLYDGATYLMHEAAADDNALNGDGEPFEIFAKASDPEVLNHPFLGWTQAGEDGKSLGPARLIWMTGWGSLDEWKDANYNGATEADWVATKHALGMLRCGQGEGSMEAYIQFPEVQLPCKITYYVGTTTDKKYGTEIRTDFQAVKDGVELEKNKVLTKASGEFVQARMYKNEVTFAGEGKASFRLWSRGRELHVYHVVFDSNYNGEIADYTVGEAGVENVAVDNVEAANAPMYNLYGQKVNKDYKGIVIQNGKKYILK